MTPKAIPLETNAFDAEYGTFARVDTESEKKSLQKQGEANGRENFPDPQASQPDAVELGLITKIAQTVQRTRAALSQHFVGFRECLKPIVRTWDSVALMDKIQTIPNRLRQCLDTIFHEFEIESAIKRPEWRDAQEDYKNFRKQNKLTRLPDYQPLRNSLFLFVGIIVVEMSLNATLLWELTGILVAFGQTALITAVNVIFLAAGFGLLFRYKNCILRKTRWLTLFCFPAIALVLAFNLGVGHYRDALVEAKTQSEQFLTPLNWDDANVTESVVIIIDYTKKALVSFWASPLGVESILSWLLIIVGIGCFGFATYKWYSMFDPYPGYKTRDVARKEAHKNYKLLLETTRNEIDKASKDAMDLIEDERTKVKNMRTLYDELTNNAQTLQTSYADWIVVQRTTQNHLVAAYRDSNRQARSEPAPDYFNDETSLDPTLVGAPDFDPPQLQNVAQVIEVVKTEFYRAQNINDEIMQKFTPLAHMQTDSDDSQST